jgi:hypothetical protein
MKNYKLDDMFKGWFVGAFSPTVLHTTAVEVAVKKYEGASHEARHFHKIATEITLLLDGSAVVNGKTFGPGDIIVLEPGEEADFRTLGPVTTVVVKCPGAPNDKYLSEPTKS